MKKPSGQKLPVEKIRTDGDTQSRVGEDPDAIDRYAAKLKDDPDFELPPGVVYLDQDGSYWPADIHHRLAAYKLAGRAHIPVDIRQGSLDDAVVFSLGANEEHGVRRTVEDRRRAVTKALAMKAAKGWSLREVAKTCKVGYEMVETVEAELAGREPPRDIRKREKIAAAAAAMAGALQSAPAASKSPSVKSPCRFSCTEPDCEVTFDRQLWHCPGCGEHWAPEKPKCRKCGGERPAPEAWFKRVEEDAAACAASDELATSAAATEQQPGTQVAVTPQLAEPEPVVIPVAAGIAPQPAAPVDRAGNPLPQKLEPVFSEGVRQYQEILTILNGAQRQVDDLLNTISQAARLGEALGESAFAGRIFNSKLFVMELGKCRPVHNALGNAKEQVAFAKPHAVCPYCQGTGEPCKSDNDGKGSGCKGHGWVDKSTWIQSPAGKKAA